MGFSIAGTEVAFSTVAVWAAAGLVVVLAWLAFYSAFGRALPDREVRDERFTRPLDRSRQRAFGGVCSGIARYFGWQVGTTRAAFVFLTLFAGGFAVVLLYMVLWVVMPLEPVAVSSEFSLGDYRVD